MKPVLLKISGFLSYASPSELDFEGFQVACISGANGAGKSSLLDAITWVLFGEARRQDDAIINNGCKSAEVELEFEYETQRYRVQRTKQREKSTVLEFALKSENGEWKSLTESSVSRTEKAICDTLKMDFDVFTNASFFLQGKADQFTQKNSTERKRILSSILELDRWEMYKETATERRKSYEHEVALLDSSLDGINEELGEEDERRSVLECINKDLKEVSEVRKAKEESVNRAIQVNTMIEQKLQQVQQLENQVIGLQQQNEEDAETLQLRMEAKESHIQIIKDEQQIKDGFLKWEKSRKDLDRLTELSNQVQQFEKEKVQFERKIDAERAKLEENKKHLLGEETKYKTSKKESKDLQKKINESATRLKLLETRLLEKTTLEQERSELQTRIAEIQVINKNLNSEMLLRKEQIKDLENEKDAICPLCKQPLKEHDRKRLAKEIETEGTAKGKAYRENEIEIKKAVTRLKDIEKDLLEINKADDEFDKLSKTITQQEIIRKHHEEVTKEWEESSSVQLADITRRLDTNDFAAEENEKVKKIDISIAKLKYDADAHEQIRQSELQGREFNDRMRAFETSKTALEGIERELKDTQKRIDVNKKKIDELSGLLQKASQEYENSAGQQSDLETLKEVLETIRKQERELIGQQAGAKQKWDVLADLKEEKLVKEETKAKLNTQIALLQQLEHACGKDGIPAMLIDQAIPEIESRANDILDGLTSGGMSVRFDTQREYRDKKREDKKEVLDIIISDAAGQRPYEMYSGGEAFRANFAIRLAISHLLTQRAGARLQTLVIDEGFGSQDAEGRQRLIEAIHQVQGDFEKIIVISHLDEMKDAFPARIEVEKTVNGSQVKVIPG